MSPDLIRYFEELGILLELPTQRGLIAFPEAQQLIVAETAANGREFLLEPKAAAAWNQMKYAAQNAGIELQMVSAYRSIQYQCDVIRRKLDRGFTIEETMQVLAPPGFSEHHTGCAVDITTSGIESVQEEFENTAAFTWLQTHAVHFDFYLSFPRGNPFGYVYEPWHWCFRNTA